MNGWPELHPLYAIPVAVALLMGFCFPVTKHMVNRRERRKYYALQLITFLSAILGAKLVFIVAELGWPWSPWPDSNLWIGSGRSIVGALIFGLLGAELAKPWFGYTQPPNDRFAALVPFSLATGRVGCLLQGCCRGLPCDAPWAIVDSAGVARHPAPAYEILFHLTAGAIAVALVRTERCQGSVFSLFLIGYGGFRFATEFLRDTPKTFASLSAYQWLSLLMIGLGTGFLVRRTRFSSVEGQTAP